MTREIPDSIRAAANQICELLERRTRVSYDEIRDELMSVECLVEDLIAARELAAIREGSELTAEQREWIERYTDFKTDSSPITKAMRAALSALDRYAAENAKLKEGLAAIRAKLAEIVCTEGCDAGVVMLSQDGPTHPETHGGRPIQVYDHEYFSPLGDALMEIWKMTGESK